MFDGLSVAIACIAAIASVFIALMADRRARAAEASSIVANRIAGEAQQFVQIQAAAAEAERLRARRATYAADFILWMRRGRVHLLTSRTLIAGDSAFVEEGERLSAQAAVLGEPRANDFLVAIKDASGRMSEVPEEKRLETSSLLNGLMQLALEKWVDDASQGPPPLDSWIDNAITQ